MLTIPHPGRKTTRLTRVADPMTYRPRTGDIPTEPGVYRFRDEHGRVIYVGKAKNLRQRLSNYFQDLSQLHPRTQQMVTTAQSVQWTVVASEIEALTLEFQWIKEFNPRFNVMFKDDKSYPYLAVSMGERYPRVQITRKIHQRDTKYYGPYTHVWAIRETIDLLLRAFPMRSCSSGVFHRAVAQQRPCLLGYIEKCAAPCTGKISEADHRELAENLCDFMDGRTRPFIRALEEQMQAASEEWDFERAAKLRDDIAALTTVLEKNSIVLNNGVDADIFALAYDELNAAVHVFYVRGGRIRGTRGWVLDRLDDADEHSLMARLLEQVYADVPPASSPLRGRPSQQSEAMSVDDVAHTPTSALPRNVYVSIAPEDADSLQAWLTQIRGAKVGISVPRRGKVADLMATVLKNAQHALEIYKTRRAGDLSERAKALEELARELDLPAAPLRIECFDISHTQGQHQVASMVVFEDGMPRKDAYRSFNLPPVNGRPLDDTAAMAETLTRRFKRLLAEEAGQAGEDDEGVAYNSGPVDPTTGRPRRFSYRPDLLVVDGGLPQVNAARATLDELGIDIPLVGLAKRLEEVWIPDDPYPLILSRASAGLYLLQYIRDESHRFAITKHRAQRGRAQTRSILDTIPGLGPARQKALLHHFGSVKRLRSASVDEICSVPGIGQQLARTIVDALAPTDSSGTSASAQSNTAEGSNAP